MTTITVAEQSRNTPDVLRLLTPRDRQRILDRLRTLDQLDGIVREAPYRGRWSW